MDNIIETQEGIFEFTSPQKISTEVWINEHLDCDAIIDNLGSSIIVYAFTKNPDYNHDLMGFKKKFFVIHGLDDLIFLFDTGAICPIVGVNSFFGKNHSHTQPIPAYAIMFPLEIRLNVTFTLTSLLIISASLCLAVLSSMTAHTAMPSMGISTSLG